MEEQLDEILKEVGSGIKSVRDRGSFEAYKASIVGPRGKLTEVMKGIGKLPEEQKPVVGRKVNEVKAELEALFSKALKEIEAEELKRRLGPPVDPTLPTPDPVRGGGHPLALIRDRLVRILEGVGFSVAEGTEIETEYYCFDALNTEPDHPARDLQDTLYTNPETRFGNIYPKGKERHLLRTHTSTVQIRVMESKQPPIRIISPGRCFRRDTPDATHSPSFHQIEALYVDQGVTVMDLKAVLDYMMRSLLGNDARTRFRPHFFPYTEPSFELDCSSRHLGKVGKEWVEMGGCGMVDPAVFEAVGYDPGEWSGYAFGFGLERLAMILYGIDDIRYFYQNDLRFLRQFK